MTIDDDKLFKQLLDSIGEDLDLTRREKQRLKQPTSAVTPENIFTWHLNQHTVFENETDPEKLRNGVRLRRVGVTESARLSEAQITAQELRLGVNLPEPWRNVYRHFNGGWSNMLYWGDLNRPRDGDPIARLNLRPEYLALEDVAPLRTFIAKDRPDLDPLQINEEWIAIAYHQSETVVLDYSCGSNPKVGRLYISEFDDDPLSDLESDDFNFWWPNMQIFFRGLYIQDRIV